MLLGHVDFSKRITNIKNLITYFFFFKRMFENEFSGTYYLRQHKLGMLHNIFQTNLSEWNLLLPDSTTRNVFFSKQIYIWEWIYVNSTYLAIQHIIHGRSPLLPWKTIWGKEGLRVNHKKEWSKAIRAGEGRCIVWKCDERDIQWYIIWQDLKN